jgi:XTP/dITP diphosphohydrolase
MKNCNQLLVLATTNKGKIADFRSMFSAYVSNILTLDDLAIAKNFFIEPEEDGATYFANSKIKADFYWNLANKVSCLADDSGIEIDSLGGAPGIHTAYFGGEDISDDERCEYILYLLKGKKNRNALCRCVLTIKLDEDVYISSEGVIEGSIAKVPRGNAGWGIEPIFIIAGSNKTVAELRENPRNTFETHRTKAIKNLLKALPV